MQVASFWTGSPLSFFERVCLVSFASRGHETALYSYDRDLEVPEGVDLLDARDILPEPGDIAQNGGFAQFADVFRLNMIKKTGAAWVDCDVACIKALPDNPYLFAYAGRWFGNAVLRLPQNSEALDYLIELFGQKTLTLPDDWPWRHLFPDEIKAQAPNGNGYQLDDTQRRALPYMTFGPVALTYALRKTGEDKHVLPAHYFYPVHPILLRRNYFRPKLGKIALEEDTVAIHHVGGKPFRNKFASLGVFVPPHSRSLIGRLCAEHGIDPLAAPYEVGPAAESEE